MKKRMTALLAALALTLGLAGCGGSSNMASGGSTAAAAPETGWAEDAVSAEAGENSQILATEGRKIIYTASLELESTAFSDTCAALEEAAARAGGYLQSSSQSGSEEDADRRASYVFRIPSDRYESFLADAENAGNALYKSESTQDVTAEYVDVEARLSSLESQRDRLEELRQQAATLEDLLAIEEQLTQVQYQIESYTGQKKVLDDQIDLATVDVTLWEVAVLTPTQNGFLARLGAAFTGGWRDFGFWFQDLIIGLAGSLPWLILLALVLTAVILLARRHGGRPSLGGQRGFGRRGRKKKEVPPAEKSDTK